MNREISLKIGAFEYDAIDVNIVGHDVYVNYKGPNAGAHTSYHASGQEHVKIGRQYVTVNGGCPPVKKLVRQRPPPSAVDTRESPSPIGWTKSQIRSLPVRSTPAHATIDVSNFAEDHIIGLLVSVIGPAEPQRDKIDDLCPVIGCFRFSEKLTVEIEAFLVEE
jgi:hypothetical protein